MKYTPPPEETDYELDENNWFKPEKIPVGETTKFMRWSTKVETDDIVDQKFIERHKNKIAAISKYMPLANYEAKHQKQIETLRSDIIDMMMDAGLTEDAENVAIESWRDANYSRGKGGFWTKEWNTNRQKLKQEFENIKKDREGGFFRKKKPDQTPPIRGEVTW